MRLARIAAPEVFADPMASMTRSAHETSACVIETDGLCRDFGGRRAVDNVTLRVPAGGVFGLLGPNGAGKTSTIRLLLGVLEPSCGSARVFGLDTRTQGAAIRERAGALLEEPLAVVLGRKTLGEPLREAPRFPAIKVEDRPLGHVVADAVPVERGLAANVEPIEIALQEDETRIQRQGVARAAIDPAHQSRKPARPDVMYGQISGDTLRGQVL